MMPSVPAKYDLPVIIPDAIDALLESFVIEMLFPTLKLEKLSIEAIGIISLSCLLPVCPDDIEKLVSDIVAIVLSQTFAAV